MENFGQRLRNLRGGRSQKEVATALGMPATTLSTLENQENAPRGEVLQKLAEHFKVPVSYFFRTPDSGPKASTAAREWLQRIRTSQFTVKETVATNANELVDDETKKRIAKALKKRHAEISTDK
jgi:transcriptional regulator with XRE-family HTH domain